MIYAKQDLLQIIVCIAFVMYWFDYKFFIFKVEGLWF